MCGGGARVHAAGVTVAFAAPGKSVAGPPPRQTWTGRDATSADAAGTGPRARLALASPPFSFTQHQTNNTTQSSIKHQQQSKINLFLLFLLFFIIIIIFFYYILAIIFYKNQKSFFFRHFLKINPMEGTHRNSPTLSTEWRTSIPPS